MCTAWIIGDCGTNIQSYEFVQMKQILVIEKDFPIIMDKVRGYIENIIYRNNDNGYTVFNLISEGEEITNCFLVSNIIVCPSSTSISEII